MRVLIACNVYPPNFVGGAELIAHQQAKTLQAMGHEVEVFAGETQAFGQRHEMRRDIWDGIAVNRISMLPQDYDPHYVIFAKPVIEAHFGQVLARFRPDVFHGHNLSGLSVTLPHLARQAGAATVVTLHDHWGYCFKNTIIKEGTRVCGDFSRCAECMPSIDEGEGRAIPIRFRNDFVRVMLDAVDAFVSPSRYLAQSYVKAGFPEERLHVIWNGIDVARFGGVVKKRSDGLLRFTYVGVLEPHKGVQTLLEALGHLPADARVLVNVVGAGGMVPAYEQVLAANGRRGKVKFWGRVEPSRIHTVYAETDVLVLPSIWPENQPVSITEAMSCGIPSIVSDMGGMLELVEDEVSGDVFPAGDAAALARKIGAYIADPARSSRLGAAARARIQRHCLVRQVEELLEIYRGAQSLPGPGASGDRVVACVGRKVCEATAKVAQALGAQGWRFVMREWLPADLAARARWTWLADPDMEWAEAAPQVASHAPLMVDVRNAPARGDNGCIGSALFFSDTDHAVGLVQTVESDERVRQELAARAARLAGTP